MCYNINIAYGNHWDVWTTGRAEEKKKTKQIKKPASVHPICRQSKSIQQCTYQLELQDTRLTEQLWQSLIFCCGYCAVKLDSQSPAGNTPNTYPTPPSLSFGPQVCVSLSLRVKGVIIYQSKVTDEEHLARALILILGLYSLGIL